MTFALHVDATALRGHLIDLAAELARVNARLTPVIKGNGYGFTRELLAHEASRLNVQRICVGTIWEVESVAQIFTGKIQVLEPINFNDVTTLEKWRDVLSRHADQVLVAVASTNTDELVHVGVKHIVVELLTSLHRFGLKPQGVAHIVSTLSPDIQLHGFNIHLPIANPTTDNFVFSPSSSNKDKAAKVQEILGWISWLRDIVARNDVPLSISLSHIDVDEITAIKAVEQNVSIDVRLGTSLWLEAAGALRVTGTVLAVHEVKPSGKVGYTQTAGGKRLVVVSGGTSHGVALAAPKTTSSLRKRGIAIAEGLAQAVGRVRSPFVYRGTNLYFAEPPHMHVSLLWCDDPDITVGDELLCTVRNTTANFDTVIGLSE